VADHFVFGAVHLHGDLAALEIGGLDVVRWEGFIDVWHVMSFDD
jgi:hypothetical protein